MVVLTNDQFLKKVEDTLKKQSDKNDGTVWFTVKKLTSADENAAITDSKSVNASRRISRLNARARAARAIATREGTPEALAAAAIAEKLAADATPPQPLALADRRTVPTALLFRLTNGSKKKSVNISTVVTPDELRAFNGAFCFAMRQGCTSLKKLPAASGTAISKPAKAKATATTGASAPSRGAGRDD